MNKTFKDFKEKENLLFDHTVWLMTAMDVTAEHLHGELVMILVVDKKSKKFLEK